MNNLYDTFRRGVAPKDIDLMLLHHQLSSARNALDDLKSSEFKIVRDHLQQELDRVVESLAERGIGFAVHDGLLIGARLYRSSLYTAIYHLKAGIPFEWVNQYRTPDTVFNREIAQTIASNILDLHSSGANAKPSSFKNHYDYLDRVLPVFWLKRFDKSLDESGCSGIVGAHGDKGYQYREQWLASGVPFFHGMLLYMLTYTPLMTYEKHHSRWAVVEFYHHYKSLIVECENAVLGREVSV